MNSSEFFQNTNSDQRYNALCNAIGSNMIGFSYFIQECKAYDKKYNCHDTNQKTSISIQPDSFNNIINYVLTNIPLRYTNDKYSTKYSTNGNFTPDSIDGCTAVILFDNTHIWTIRPSQTEGYWVELDTHIKFINPHKPIGFHNAIFIYKNIDHSLLCDVDFTLTESDDYADFNRIGHETRSHRRKMKNERKRLLKKIQVNQHVNMSNIEDELKQLREKEQAEKKQAIQQLELETEHMYEVIATYMRQSKMKTEQRDKLISLFANAQKTTRNKMKKNIKKT
jgi:hypothetical protein